MKARLAVLGIVGLAVGLAAQWLDTGFAAPRRWLPDLAVGWAFVACGLVGQVRRPDSRTGMLLTATGFSWFLFNFRTVPVAPLGWAAAQTVFLHRAVLMHTILSFPTGRLRSRLTRGATVLIYVALLAIPIDAPILTLGSAGLLVAVALAERRRSRGARRWAQDAALRAAWSFGLVLTAGVVAQQTLPGGTSREVAVLGYRLALVVVAVGLLMGLVRDPSPAVTDLVVELIRGPGSTLQDRLARVLGDPSLELVYRLPGGGGYVDAHGRPTDIPAETTERAVTPIEVDGQVLAVLLHDPAVLDDPQLVASLATAARLAASNVQLQADVQAQITEVEASRRRLVEAAGRERRRLQRRLADTAERRLRAVGEALERTRDPPASTTDATKAVDQAAEQLRRTFNDLQELARGLHPPALEAAGLAGAIEQLAGYSPLPVELHLDIEVLAPDVAATAYFVCSEALANAAKHAQASTCRVAVNSEGGWLVVEVVDDGVGGADTQAGSGLRGLRDRVEALGGELTVESPAGSGTRLTADIPLG